MSNNDTIVVNLSDYAEGRVQIHATQSETKPTHWEISIFSMDRVWLGDGKYVAEYGRGIEDCDANFSEVDFRLMDEALGIMAKEFPELQAEWESAKEERAREAILDAADWKHQ
jgi:hypothetical protein